MSNIFKSISNFYSPKKFFVILIILLVLSAFTNSFIFLGVGSLIAIALFITCKFFDANTYDKAGFAEYKKEDYKGAIADYDRAIEVDPKNADFYRKLMRAC